MPPREWVPAQTPALAEGSRGPLPNRAQDNEPENGSQAAAGTDSSAHPGPVVQSNHQRKAKAAAVQPPPVVVPVPRPYIGAVLPGIAYIHRAQDLPDPKGLPMVVGFDLETWNRRTDIWRHKASLFPFLGGEIRLAQISDGHQSLVIDVALIGGGGH